MRWVVLFLLLLLTGFTEPHQSFTRVCPGVSIQARTPDFSPGGIILTTFDKSGIWVYNIDRDSRYPLPQTRPCNRQCRLSPDARWMTYVDPQTGAYGKMRLDGTQRTVLADYASDIEWWSDDRLLIWTPGHQAYIRNEQGTEQRFIDVSGIVSIQPSSTWGLNIALDGDTFVRSLLNLATRNLSGIARDRLPLGEDKPFFNASGWSPNGLYFAYVASGPYDDKVGIAGGELFMIQPEAGQSQPLTDLNSIYGAVRINGGVRGDLSWSPDSTRIAFWVIELLGTNYEADTGNALIHIIDTRTGELRAYCGFATSEHTPDPPRLQWSPDGTYIAFGGNVPADDKGYLLLALDTETGIFTELSNGIYPATGIADVMAWGLPPG